MEVVIFGGAFALIAIAASVIFFLGKPGQSDDDDLIAARMKDLNPQKDKKDVKKKKPKKKMEKAEKESTPRELESAVVKESNNNMELEPVVKEEPKAPAKPAKVEKVAKVEKEPKQQQYAKVAEQIQAAAPPAAPVEKRPAPVPVVAERVSSKKNKKEDSFKAAALEERAADITDNDADVDLVAVVKNRRFGKGDIQELLDILYEKQGKKDESVPILKKRLDEKEKLLQAVQAERAVLEERARASIGQSDVHKQKALSQNETIQQQKTIIESLQHLRDQASSAQRTISVLQSEKQALESAKHSVEEHMHVLQSAVQENAKIKGQNERQIAELKRQVEKLEKIEKQQQQQTKAAAAPPPPKALPVGEANQLRYELGVAQNRVTTLESDLHTSSDLQQRAEHERRVLLEQNEKLRAELDASRQEAERMRIKLKEGLDGKLSASGQELEVTKRQLEQSQKEAVAHQRDAEEAHSRLQSVEKQVRQLEQRQHHPESQVKGDDMAAMQQWEEKLNEKEMALIRVGDELSSQRQTNDAAKGELGQKQAENERLMRELEANERKQAELQRELEVLKTQSHGSTANSERTDELETELAEERQSNDKLRTRSWKLKEDLDQKERELDELRVDRQKRLDEADQCREALKRAEADLRHLETSVVAEEAKYRETIDKLQKEKEEEKRTAVVEVTMDDAERKQLQEDLQRIQEQLQTLQGQIQSLTKELSDERDKVKQSNTERAKLQSLLKIGQDAFKEEQETNRKLNEQIERTSGKSVQNGDADENGPHKEMEQLRGKLTENQKLLEREISLNRTLQQRLAALGGSVNSSSVSSSSSPSTSV